MVAKETKTVAKKPTPKAKKYKDASMLLKDGALELSMQRSAKKGKIKKRTVNAALVLWAPLLLLWGGAQASEDVRDVINDNPKVETVLGIYGMIAAVAAFMALATAPIYSNEDASEIFRGQISKLLSDKTLDPALNRELIRLAPVFQDMAKYISEKSNITATEMARGELSDANAERISRGVRQYLLANPDQARKFINVLTIAEVPQQVIDNYIIHYVPDTLSFSMAKKLMDGKAK